MQVKNINISNVSKSSITKAASVPTGFAQTLDSSMARTNPNKNVTNTASISQDRITHDKTRLIKLGNISPAQPTVSHLSINHPEYGQECWKIIHSDLNKDKPYTQIPDGTKIYLEPESKEIIWDNTNYNRTSTRTINFTHASGIAQPTLPTRSPNHSNHRIKSNEQYLIDQSVSRASTRYNLPQELIKAVIKAESDFQTRAVSSAGAQGLMQLMPSTAKELGVKNPFDIRENIEGGARYLKKMLDIFSGNLEQALAAYNAGPQAVKNHQGRIPFQETRLYVKRVISFLDHFK
jgi:hypothetical protein